MERFESVPTPLPEAVAAILGAVPGGTLVWSVEPGSGAVAVSLDKSAKVRTGRSKKSSKLG